TAGVFWLGPLAAGALPDRVPERARKAVGMTLGVQAAAVPAIPLAPRPLPPRAAIYCRISRDPRGDLLGVQRQAPPCRALCERLGWEVVEVYTDDDLSAYTGKHRPASAEM